MTRRLHCAVMCAHSRLLKFSIAEFYHDRKGNTRVGNPQEYMGRRRLTRHQVQRQDTRERGRGTVMKEDLLTEARAAKSSAVPRLTWPWFHSAALPPSPSVEISPLDPCSLVGKMWEWVTLVLYAEILTNSFPISNALQVHIIPTFQCPEDAAVERARGWGGRLLMTSSWHVTMGRLPRL